MAVTINGNTGVVTGLAALPDSAMASGSIIQVVNTGVTSTSSLNLTSISTWYTISSLDTTITTSSANSKILINAQIYGEADAADYVTCFKIVKVIEKEIYLLQPNLFRTIIDSYSARFSNLLE